MQPWDELEIRQQVTGFHPCDWLITQRDFAKSMNAPVSPPTAYADSAYRSTAIPVQPPHKWPQVVNRASPTRTQLRWGH